MTSIIEMVDQKALVDGENVVNPSRTDAISRELEADRRAAQIITQKFMKHLRVADAYQEMRRGSWRDPGTLEDLSNVLVPSP